MGTPVQEVLPKMDILQAPLIDEIRKEITNVFYRLKEFHQFHMVNGIFQLSLKEK